MIVYICICVYVYGVENPEEAAEPAGVADVPVLLIVFSFFLTQRVSPTSSWCFAPEVDR